MKARSEEARLSLLKADIDSAYKRVLVQPGHRQYAHVAFTKGGEIYVAQHLSAPFGAVSSVHNWDRIGNMIAVIARRVLKIGILRFVDDFFTGERQDTAQVALDVFARRVLAVLRK